MLHDLVEITLQRIGNLPRAGSPPVLVRRFIASP
jgi:hypothetical protein